MTPEVVEATREDVDQMTLDVHEAIYRHRPDIGQVMTLTMNLLNGVITQLSPESQQEYRNYVINHMQNFDEQTSNKVYDLTPLLDMTKHH